MSDRMTSSIHRWYIKEVLATLGQHNRFRVPPTRLECAIDKLRVKLGFKSRLPVLPKMLGATVTIKRPPRYNSYPQDIHNTKV